MKKIPTILTTSLLLACAPSVYAKSSTAKSIADLEARIAQLEQSSEKFGSFLKGHKVFGRLQYDKTFVTNNNELNLQNNSKLRRGRLGLKGKMAQDWGYKFEIDFAKDASNVTDAYISKSLPEQKASIKIGQQKEPFSLEELTSSRFITFLERAAINGFAPGRNIGISYSKHFNNANLYAGVFGDAIGDDSDTDGETVSGTARLAFYDKSEDNNVLHLAGSYRVSEPTGDEVSFKFKPEASIETSSSAVKTGAISNVDKVNQYGLEAAIVEGPLSLQAEYINTEVTRDSGAIDYTLQGYYVQASVFLTGEQRNYSTKSSAFGRVKPLSTKGAWELAYRYSYTDANDDGLDNGEMENSSVGVNYYATKNVKLMANYIDVNVDENSVYQNDVEIVAFRAQIDF